MVIVSTIATTRKLGSIARVKLGMSCRSIKRAVKVRAWELAGVKSKLFPVLVVYKE